MGYAMADSAFPGLFGNDRTKLGLVESAMQYLAKEHTAKRRWSKNKKMEEDFKIKMAEKFAEADESEGEVPVGTGEADKKDMEKKMEEKT